MKTLLNGPAALMCAISAMSCGSGNDGFDATGFFEATEVTVSSEANGKILFLDAVEGQKVTKGEKLGKIDTVQLWLTKMQLENNISSIRSNKPDIGSQIASVKAQLDKQVYEKSRVENMFESGAATAKQLDDINSSIAVLESELSAMELSLRKSNASLDAQIGALEMQVAQTGDRLAKCTVTSPIDGTVLSKYAQAGELAATGKPLLKIADTENMFLRAYFTLGQLKDIKLGQKVTVKADFGGGNVREYEGVFTWISEKSEFTPKSIQTSDDRENLVYATKIAIHNDGYVKIGMYGEVVL